MARKAVSSCSSWIVFRTWWLSDLGDPASSIRQADKNENLGHYLIRNPATIDPESTWSAESEWYEMAYMFLSYLSRRKYSELLQQ